MDWLSWVLLTLLQPNRRELRRHICSEGKGEIVSGEVISIQGCGSGAGPSPVPAQHAKISRARALRLGMAGRWVGIQRSAISISGHSRGRLCHTIPSEPQDSTGRKIGAKKVKCFWDFVCQDVPFPSQPWPTILLTAVFISPIIRSVTTESGIGGKSP
jgi:hypothetical protein